MKRKNESFTGTCPVFSGSPSIVTGGFNLDVASQHFAVGDIVPAGSLAVADEATRKVQIVRTAKVEEVGTDAKVVRLHVGEFHAPCFAVGNKVLKAGAISGTYAAAPEIARIEKSGNRYVITLSAAISGLAVGDTIVEVVDNGGNAAEIGKANAVTIRSEVVGEFETSVDVTADTMNYALYERRVAPIPASQKDATGAFLASNPHVKLSKSL